ncbi:cobyric acid synthase [Phaeovibrio sulfidiphilus]|uniref:Cobyric acid synthase n=1 Tax=Phaeovibrio sulfidiphilus TaxID=1220600 RepID=A0A8J6YMF3_9PROT|nr:cobyric acid synthase [Phaeovibrio sulfidiphilus]MBE1237130.1 cobyric acid synthase [Phaeovibrio sulfidiphilus]
MSTTGTTRFLMLQGTASDVGKSLLVTGLCRAWTRRGLRVRPFKAQNITGNVAVTPESDVPGQTGEIGRAQALQARACRVSPSVHMNPVVLRPRAGAGSLVVARGQPLGWYRARDYGALRPRLMPLVLDSLETLGCDADLVVVEGAGSPVETYLKDSDIVNMALATAADLPVLMVGDVDPGGAIAALVGTHALLEPHERERVRGYLVNKMRGDFSLFEPACRTITERTGWPCAGLAGWFDRARALPAEDSLSLERPATGSDDGTVPVSVLRFPNVANFDDLDPLALDPALNVHWVRGSEPIPQDSRVVILPGSGSSRADLEFLHARGWHHDLHAHVRHGGHVLGLGAGFRMLGHVIRDPEGLEGPPGDTPGLGLLDMDTCLVGGTTATTLEGRDTRFGVPVSGYRTDRAVVSGADLSRPFLTLALPDGTVHREGAVSACGRVGGSDLHGLLASDGFRASWLKSVTGHAGALEGFEARIEATLDALADHLESTLDLDALLALSASARF